MGGLTPTRRAAVERTRRAMPRAAEALRLRVEGRTFAEIGRALDLSPAGALFAYRRGLRHSVAEPPEELRRLWHERYEAAYAALAAALAAGDLLAIDRALKISKAERELWGLDAPKRSEFSGHGGDPMEFTLRFDRGEPDGAPGPFRVARRDGEGDEHDD